MKAQLRKAFTLIELLIVIAIIAILMAILFPVFESARERGYMAACVSNVKQLNLALLMYAQDYDECFPHYGDPGGTYTTASGEEYISQSSGNGTGQAYAQFGWVGAASNGPDFSGNPQAFVAAAAPLWQAEPRVLNSYVQSLGVTICPEWGSNLNWGPTYAANPLHTTVASVLGNSYAINTALIFPGSSLANGQNGFGNSGTDGKSVSLSQIIAPDSTGLIADGYMGWASDVTESDTPGNTFIHGGTATFDQGGGYGVQQAMVTYGFVDGHAKMMNAEGCARPNYAECYGGKISWMDSNYRNSAWIPGSWPPATTTGLNANWDYSFCQ